VTVHNVTMKTHPIASASCTASAFVIALAAMLPPGALADPAYRSEGTETTLAKSRHWATAFSARHQDFHLQVGALGTDFGFAAMLDGRVDIIHSMRRMTARETADSIRVFGRRPAEYKVCLDAVRIYVHADNPVTELTATQVAQIFSGKIRNWKHVGGPNAPIVRFGHKQLSGTREFFQEYGQFRRNSQGCCR
jgi:phosphate transport system substrate-binding protein